MSGGVKMELWGSNFICRLNKRFLWKSYQVY